jgi:outer membrane protein
VYPKNTYKNHPAMSPVSRSLGLALCAAFLSSAFVHAESSWSVRLGATYLQTVDGSTNAAVPVKVEDKWIPEIDVTYAFNATWSAELVLTIPQKHKVSSGGAALGEFKHLPPTLLIKYTPELGGAFRPYVGAGINATLIFDDRLAGGLKLDTWSFGPAGQVGADWVVNERWALNVDVKRVMLRTDVKAGGVKLTEARLDPWLFSVGARLSF